MTCMVVPDRTRTAIQRTPRGACSAIHATLRVLRWSGKPAPVQCFVAGDTKSQSVIDIKRQVWKLRQRLDMVSVYIAFVAALLASVVVALKNGLAPLGKIALVLTAAAVCGDAAFPCGGFFASKNFSTTGTRAESGALVSAIERLAAILAFSWLRWVASRPACFGAVMCRVGAVSFDLKFLAALLAYLGNLRVFHTPIVPHSTQICTSYVALQRYADHTGKTPVLLTNE